MPLSISSPDGEQTDWEEWHLRHLAQRARQFGLDGLQKLLLDISWKKQGDEPPDCELNSRVSVAFERLANIPKFASSCSRNECDICHRLIARFSRSRDSGQKWQLAVETYRWQKEAEEIWFKNNGSGIVKVVTGAGKTVLALSLISQLKQSRAYRDGGLRTVIVVPTVALLDQWYSELKEMLFLEDADIGEFYGERKEPFTKNPITLYVLPSAAKYLPEHQGCMSADEDLFLIVDECHRSGSSVYSKVYDSKPVFTLGLSATPERRMDFGFEEVLVPELGPVIYEYGYQAARDDGIIPPFRLKRVGVHLAPHESKQYKEFSEDLRETYKKIIGKYPILQGVTSEGFLKRLGELQRETEDPLLETYTVLANKRKAIVHTSENKMKALAWIIENELATSTKTLIFHERIKSANEIYDYLRERGIRASIYHSELPPPVRKDNLIRYRRNDARVLVTCRALDEGLDVPATGAGIIVAATSSIRQRIQRIGRILRRAPGKDHSLIYTVIIEDIEEAIYGESVMKEIENAAERVEHIRLG